MGGAVFHTDTQDIIFDHFPAIVSVAALREYGGKMECSASVCDAEDFTVLGTMVWKTEQDTFVLEDWLAKVNATYGTTFKRRIPRD